MNARWKLYKPNSMLGVVLLAAFIVWPAHATSVMQMNLAELSGRAGQIFTGTVIEVTASSVAVGGGELPVLRYRLRVDESFKGQFSEEKGVLYTEVTMLGTLDQLKSQQNGVMPFLQQGKEYLLMVAPAGPAGITSTVGLVQGKFSLGADKEKMAVNGANNVGLFAGMNTATQSSFAANTSAQPMTLNSHQGGPVPYAVLAELIRREVEAN